MATFSQPGQNLSFQIPDQGVYRLDNGGFLIRSGNNVYSTNLQELGIRSAVDQGLGTIGPSGFVSSDPRLQSGAGMSDFGRQFFTAMGLDYNAIPMYGGNVADIQTAFGSAPKDPFSSGFSLGSIADLFKIPTAPGTNITKSADPDNPYGALVTDSSGATLQNSPALAQTLLNAGATPQQVVNLVTAAGANLAAGGTSGALPYSTAQLTQAGVQPPPPAPGSTTLEQIQNNMNALAGGISAASGQAGVALVPGFTQAFPELVQPVNLNNIGSTVGQGTFENFVSSTPPSTTGLTGNYSSFENILNKYLATIAPTQGEKDTQAALDKLNQVNAQAQATTLNEAIPMDLINAKLGDIAKKYAYEKLPLEQQLQRFSSEREGQLDTLQAAYGFAKDQLNFSEQKARDVAALRDDSRTALFGILDRFGGLNWDDLDSASQSELTKLASSSGVPIGLVKSGMSTIKEQQLAATADQRAIQNEFTRQRLGISAQSAGIMAQIRALNYANLTGVSPGQIVNSSTGLPVKLTDEQIQRFSGYDTFSQYYIPSINSLLDRVETGGAKGRILQAAATVPFAQNLLSPDEQSLLSLLSDMNNTLLYLKSGKQINEAEFARLSQAMPSLNMTNQQNKINITNFANTLQSLYGTQLSVAGLMKSSGGSIIPRSVTDPSPGQDYDKILDNLLSQYGQ